MTQVRPSQKNRLNRHALPDKVAPVRLVQMTDPHLFGEPGKTLLGLDTADSFQQVLNALPAGTIDRILLTGDIAQDASASAYERLISMVTPLGLPFHWVPGNHDNAALMSEIAQAHGSGINDRVIQVGPWRLIMLDTSVEREVYGELTETELDHLQHELANAERFDQFCLICLHHNPVPGTSDWMLDIGLKNADQLTRILKPSRARVKAVLFGHIHQNIDHTGEDGIRYICTPSTSIQFKPHVTDFELDALHPAYRWLDLYDDGRIDTGVHHLQDFELTIDMSAPGY